MITKRHYKDYTIVVSRIDNNIGKGFRASFFVEKDNGTTVCHQCYDTYRRKTIKDTVADVEKIIDAVC